VYSVAGTGARVRAACQLASTETPGITLTESAAAQILHIDEGEPVRNG
jgi:hypothetical protein